MHDIMFIFTTGYEIFKEGEDVCKEGQDGVEQYERRRQSLKTSSDFCAGGSLLRLPPIFAHKKKKNCGCKNRRTGAELPPKGAALPPKSPGAELPPKGAALPPST